MEIRAADSTCRERQDSKQMDELTTNGTHATDEQIKNQCKRGNRREHSPTKVIVVHMHIEEPLTQR